MDVQDLKLDDQEFDIVVCYHVLDYVTDDRKAMREIFRVLKPGGVLISQEGMIETQTTEEWGKPRRDKQYRIRQYGSDFPQRVQQAAGFSMAKIYDSNKRSVYLFTKF